MTPQQYQAWVRAQQNLRRQAIDRYNREVDQFNRAEKARVDAVNREIQRVNQHNKQVAQHNRQVVQRANQQIEQHNRQIVQRHNAAVVADRQRVARALASLRQQPAVVRYTVLQSSVYSLNDQFSALQKESTNAPAAHRRLLVDLPERENANSLEVLSALAGNGGEFDDAAEADDFGPALAAISPDLMLRWKGAKHALDPENPDAARHFCASSREIFTRILDLRAPAEEVLRVLPHCEKTQNGAPTRRAKIYFALQRKKIGGDGLVSFADTDINNVVELFKVFNTGTHGEAGTYSLGQLTAIRRRVEDGMAFLIEVMS